MLELFTPETLERYGITILIILFIIEKFTPVVSRLLESIVPGLVQRRKTIDEKNLELREKELDLQEREVSARESVAQSLILLKNNQDRFLSVLDEMKLSLDTIISAQMIEAQNIAVILDRSLRIRTSDLKKKGDM